MQARVFVKTVSGALAAFVFTAGVAMAQPASPPAAMAAPTIEAILKALSVYDGGIESAAVWQLRDFVLARAGDPAGLAACEATLLAFLKTSATAPAKAAAARQLRLMAADTALPALQAMAIDPRLVDYAIYVLQPMPGTAADAALIKALAIAKGSARTAIIVALGDRRAADAVAALTPALGQADVAVAAATALGRIGTPAAADALRGAASRATGSLKPAIASALLACAEARLASNERAAAAAIYDSVAALSTPAAPLSDAVRRAVAIGRIAAAESRAPAVLLELLRGGDPLGRDAAVASIRDVFAPDAIGPVCDAVPALPESVQMQVLAALVAYPGPRISATVTLLMASPSADIRAAAIRTFAAYGGGEPGAAVRLAGLAARTRGGEQAAARWALGNLKGAAVDADILGMLAKPASDALAVEAMVAAADRRLFLGRPAIADLLASPARPVRLQALKSLRELGTPSDGAAVLDLLIATDDDVEGLEAEKTIGALMAMVRNPDARGRLLRGKLVAVPPAAPPPAAARARMLAVLPLTGDNSTLPLLRQALQDPDSAVVDAAARALAEWPTPAVRDDLRALAKDAAVDTHRLLAVRGLIRVIGLEAYRQPNAAVADLTVALGLATRPEERKLVLGALPSFGCPEAVALATSLLTDPDVKAEAQAAVDRLTATAKSAR